jgi:hypothetical protein
LTARPTPLSSTILMDSELLAMPDDPPLSLAREADARATELCLTSAELIRTAHTLLADARRLLGTYIGRRKREVVEG